MRTEDGYIVYKCLNGDTSAFGLLVDKYKEAVYALAYSKLHNFQDAEDITQEVFIKAFQKLRTLRWWDNFVAWLYCITSNLCKDLIRSKSTRPDREYIADYETLNYSSLDSFREESEFETLHEALNSLPEIYRQVLIMYYFSDMNTHEIGRFLGISANNVAQRLKRARSKLKEGMIEMMSETYLKKKLKAGFTFRIVEIIKKIKIQPAPKVPWLPWTVSATTGIILTILYFTASLAPLNDDYANYQNIRNDKKESDYQYLYGKNLGPIYEDISITPVVISDEIIYGQINDKQGQLAIASVDQATSLNPTEIITISGKVIRDDISVANAQAYVYNQETGERWETLTQTDGSFQLKIPKPERLDCLLIVSAHPQHSLGWSKLTEDKLTDLVVNLSKPASITGKITDEQNNPIREAKINIVNVTIPTSRIIGRYTETLPGSAFARSSIKTDSTGMFAFNNLPAESNVDIEVSCPGYAKERKYNISAGSQRVTIKLRQGCQIEGRVTFSDTSKPAQGLKISANGIIPTEGWGTTRTDSNGYYVINDLPSGDYVVMLGEELPDWTAVAKENIKVSKGMVSKNIDLQLVKGGFITGRVTYKDTSEPIPKHAINFYDASRPESQSSIKSATTDENGFYRFRAAPGKAKVYTVAPGGYEYGFESKYVDVKEGGIVQDVNFQFQKVPLINITCKTISDDGKTIPDALIFNTRDYSIQYGKSDKDGKCTITGLRSGLKISIAAENTRLQMRGYADIESKPDEEFKIVMKKYDVVNISGRVVNSMGDPVPSANIVVIKMETGSGRGLGTSYGMTNDFGEYTVNGLVVGDQYQISASAEGYMLGTTSIFTASEEITSMEDILLQLPEGNFLQGRILDTNGKPIIGAIVSASSVVSKSITDENGYYRLDGIPQTIAMSVNISHPNYGDNAFHFIKTNQTRDFLITKADRYLAGKVVDSKGDPVADVVVIVEPQHDIRTGHLVPAPSTNWNGEFQLEHLLDEKVDICLSSNTLGFNKIFKNVYTNREDVVFVFDKSLEPPYELTAEQEARQEYNNKARKRLETLSGNPAPELDVSQWLNCEPMKIADLKGKVVLIYFWSYKFNAFTDARSTMKLDFLNLLQEEYGSKGLVCIGIHEFTTQIDEVKKVLAEKKPKFAIAIDKEINIPGADGATCDKYGDSWFPILIDKQGKVYGSLWTHEVEETIEKLLSQ